MATSFQITFTNGQTKQADTILADQIQFEDTARRRGWGTVQETPIMACAFFAFAALKRTGEFAGSWDDFLAQVEAVHAVKDADEMGKGRIAPVIPAV